MSNYVVQREPDFSLDQYKLTVIYESDETFIQDLTEAFHNLRIIGISSGPGKAEKNRTFKTNAGDIYVTDEAMSFGSPKSSYRIYTDKDEDLLLAAELSLDNHAAFESLKPKKHSLVEPPEREGFLVLLFILFTYARVYMVHGASGTIMVSIRALFMMILFGGMVFGVRRILQINEGRKFLDPLSINNVLICFAVCSVVSALMGL